jgi:phage baseplate assembly protein W
MMGMDRTTGLLMTGSAHLAQSIADILTTPLGSRRERPEYGSHLPRMVDLPVNAGWIAAAQAEIARNLVRWEPRIKVSKVTIISVIDGRVNIKISGIYLGDSMLLEVTA